ncbi:MAG TPA: hypothetical protein VFG68_11555, partial [Fimbriiglobus sp.]|nr:hypothetical protein [Fimbriiglobus sp.]
MAFSKMWGRLLRRVGRRWRRDLTDRPALWRFLRPRRLPLSMELLEDRIVPSYLFVDFGDRFPGSTLTTTQGAFRDVATDPVGANRILGTTVLDAANNFTAGTTLDIHAQAFTATERDQMMDVVRRAYRPMDVTIVDLTSTAQPTADGRSVRAAANLNDVITTLRGGDAASRDAYVFVGKFIVDPGGASQLIYDGVAIGGNSPSSPVLGETSDLVAASNVHDDVAAVFSSGFSNNTLNNISHEAGHLFGLQHSITNATGVAATDLFHQAEIMSYENTNVTTSSIAFTRYPMIRGDGNSPGGAVLNYNDLAARNGQVTLYDQLRLDANVGPNPNYSFVSGTGAHDIITITRNGPNADVTVQAFGDAAYTAPITVPGEADTTYSYSIPLTKTILVFAGGSDDRIVIEGDLGVDVEIDGMLGTDTLVVDGKGAADAVYTPNPSAPDGADVVGGANVNSFGGTVAVGGRTIRFEDFEAAGSVTLSAVGAVTVVGSDALDNFTATPAVAGTIQVIGTVNGGTAVVPLTLQTTVNKLALDTRGSGDILTVTNPGGVVYSSGRIVLRGGSGNDTMTGSVGEDVLTGGRGNDSITGGDGTDTVDESADPL